MAIAWKYTGDGSFVVGVPPRDLAADGEDAERVKEFEEREGVGLEETGLYERADAPAAAKSKTGGGKPSTNEGE